MNNPIPLFQFNQFIRRVISLNFPEAIWVRAEVDQINKSRSGYFIELVQKEEDSDRVKAQISAVLWTKAYGKLLAKHKSELNNVLKPGVEIVCKLQAAFHERYGLKVSIEDVDIDFNIGQLALKRKAIINQLEEEDLLYKNRTVQVSEVISNIAIISSATAAGYKDFLAQIQDNAYGYKYKTVLFSASMQGELTESEVINALDHIALRREEFDAVCLIRGGGSRLDLGSFDSYLIGEKIANYSLPIFVGIGHEIDQTIPDLVAFRSLKTPTAVAEYFIQHNATFEEKIESHIRKIYRAGKAILIDDTHRIKTASKTVQFASNQIIKEHKFKISTHKITIESAYKSIIGNLRMQLLQKEQKIHLSNPMTIMERGFAMIFQDEVWIKNMKDLNDTKMTIAFKDGQINVKKE